VKSREFNFRILKLSNLAF